MDGLVGFLGKRKTELLVNILRLPTQPLLAQWQVICVNELTNDVKFFWVKGLGGMKL